MKNFTYFRPSSAEEAVGLLEPKWGKTELLAGGTDLLDLQKQYIAQPEKVVSLGAIPGIADIKVQGRSGVTIGAGAKLADIAENKDLRKLFPALTAAAADI